MPRKDEPRVTIRLAAEDHAFLEGLARGSGRAVGTLLRDAGLRALGAPSAAGATVSAAGAASSRAAAAPVGIRPPAGAAPAILEDVVLGLMRERFGGRVFAAQARREVRMGRVRVGGEVVRDPTLVVDPAVVSV